MTVKEMMKDWLYNNGYDGLRSDDCGCQLSDLMPCENASCTTCQPGHKIDKCICGEGCDFHIVENPSEYDGIEE